MAYFFSGSDELAKADNLFDLSYDMDTDTDLGFIPTASNILRHWNNRLRFNPRNANQRLLNLRRQRPGNLGFISAIAGGLLGKALPFLKAAVPLAKRGIAAAAQKKAAAKAAARARTTQLAQLAQRKQAEDRAKAQQRQAQQQAEAQARAMQQAPQQSEWQFFPEYQLWYNFNFQRWFDPQRNQYV